MSAAELSTTAPISLSPEIAQAAAEACHTIAPTWPLDQLIAVNPWWELKHRPFADVAAELQTLAKIQCLMPKSYYQSLWQAPVTAKHLEQAADSLGIATTTAHLREHLRQSDWQGHWHNLSDWLDSYGARRHRMAWQDEITQQISQYCAETFQEGTPFHNGEQAGLYAEWLDLTRQDRGLEILMGEPKLRQQFKALPTDYQTLLAEACEELAINNQSLKDYFTALLLDISGWASWVAYVRWQDQLNDKKPSALQEELLCIRLAWDLALWRHYKQQHAKAFIQLKNDWKTQWQSLPQVIKSHRDAQKLTWVWHKAAELAYQQQLHTQLLKAAADQTTTSTTPHLHAVFCIDVRSEPIRRALEAQNASITTSGFAGFFGLPLEYQPEGTELTRPQLPGLLKAGIQVSEKSDDLNTMTQTRKRSFWQSIRFNRLHDASPATFSLVEAAGLRYGFTLLKNTFTPPAPVHPVNQLANSKHWHLSKNGQALSIDDKVELVQGVLSAMGLTHSFANVTMLVGHGSSTCNNPHAAGLDCGACGGQTGEINVRVLADLLNNQDIRSGLTERGISIPTDATFVPALHNTTTDDITCLNPTDDQQVTQWLSSASEQARQQRAASLGIDPSTSAKDIQKIIESYSRDWSQVRPEWGLANNASFIVAPRTVTKAADLQGRSFLHDYDWQNDTDFALLELIMTAPMIVTNWINMQYNASVTDNQKYGSGNKVLHNVVGGNLGVFEGNGGDLRIGLPLQSVHNGTQWMHQPQRLSVYLAAPKEAISDIVNKHPMLADLINNDWLYIFQWNLQTQTIAQLYQSQWQEVSH